MDSSISLLIIPIGLLLGILIATKPRFGVLSLLISTMVFTGLVEYFFPSMGRVKWANVLISFFLLLRAVGDKCKSSASSRGSLPSFVAPMLLLCVSIFFTTVYNRSFTETLLGAKNYFQYWPVPFILYWSIRDKKFIEKCLYFFVLLAVFMPAVTLVQKFILHSPPDTITGTFGSSYLRAGGPNAVLSIFIVLQIGYLIMCATEGLISYRKALVYSALSSITLMMTSARAVLGFIVIMFLFLYGKRLLRFDAKAITVSLLAGTLVMGLAYSYFLIAQQKDQTWVENPEDISEMYEQSISNNFGDNRFNRFTAIQFWWEKNKGDTVRLMIGYGLGSTKFGGLSMGRVQKKYPNYKIGFTALATLLWEVGIIGAFLYISIFLRMFFVAGRLKSIISDKQSKIFMAISQIACLFAIISIPYKLSIIETQAFNFYMMFVVGHIGYWQNISKNSSAMQSDI